MSPSESTQKRVGGATVAILVRSSPQGHYAGVATRSFNAAKIESIELPKNSAQLPAHASIKLFASALRLPYRQLQYCIHAHASLHLSSLHVLFTSTLPALALLS